MMMVPPVMMMESRSHVNVGNDVMKTAMMMMALMMVVVPPMMVVMLHLQGAIN